MEVNGIVQMYRDTEFPRQTSKVEDRVEDGIVSASAETIVNIESLENINYGEEERLPTFVTALKDEDKFEKSEKSAKLDRIDTDDIVKSYYGSNEELLEKKSKHICCFQSKKQAVAFSIALFITAIVIVTLGAFFLVPRMPIVAIQNVSSPKTANITSTNNKIDINVSMEVQVSIENSNFMPIDLSDVSVAADWIVKGEINGILPFGNGNIKSLVIKPRSSSTFTVPFKIIYSGDYRNDTLLQDFISRCTNNDVNSRIIEMNYRVSLKNAQSPIIRANHKIGCPLSPDQVKSIIALIQRSNGTANIPFQV